MKKPSPRQREALEAVAAGRCIPCLRREADGWHARWRGMGTDNPWIDEYMRSASMSALSADAEDQKHETIHDAWILALRSRTGLVRRDEAECAAFASVLDAWAGTAEGDETARASVAIAFISGTGAPALECAAPHGRRALRALGQAAFIVPALKRLSAKGSPDGKMRVELERTEADDFISRGARDLASAGYGVEGCDIAADVSAEAEIEPAPENGENGGGGKLKLVVRVAGRPVDAEEIRFLLDQKSSVVFFRDRWIEVDRGILKEALRVLERQDGRDLTRNEAVAFACGAGSCGSFDVAEAAAHGWLRGLVNELKMSGERVDVEDVPLKDILRPYQRRGAGWMKFLTDRGFGALLADDMGLGKTVQTLSWILAQSPAKPFLVVAPLSLLANWRREAAKFAPSLKVFVHQGANRAPDSFFVREASAADVVVTSYSLLVRDWQAIRRVRWEGAVLDEAQNIKNPSAQVARAACALSAPKRVALTGTPVENSPADVWSLENFLNPGLLGDRKTFDANFTRPIRENPRGRAAGKLSRVLEPFVLRRLKSAPGIADELGSKRVVREFCALSPRQRARYEAALDEFGSGERKRGDVFALITRLKLACDGQGKFDRLCDLLDSIFESGESALVFTQYAKVGAALAEKLAARYSRPCPFLHGALSPAERERQIAVFDSSKEPCAFVLSLRAGGYGLNLVKASHVIHFDRWWNPAVEAQATDRAHRIGRKGDVLVHLFITEGTIEERVDEILERKSLVAGSLVAGGERFLMSLSPDEIESIARLG